MLGTVGMALRRVGHLLALGTVLAGMSQAWCPCAFALDPKLDIGQYAHTAWRIREGFAKGMISSMAQTPDGYLWLGTDFGLFRFDGVRNIPWQPPPDQHLPSNQIFQLFAARDGTLWIGTAKGLASWKGGKLTQYPELAGKFVFAILEDHEGTVWVGAAELPNAGRLCAIQNGTVHCAGGDGSLGPGVMGLYEDHKGSLWVGVQNGLWRWRPDTPEFLPMPDSPDGIQSFADSDDGALLVVTRNGLRRIMDGKTEPYLVPGPAPQFRPERLLRDRKGGLWIATRDRGLLHVHDGRTDSFTRADGLSGDASEVICEDREGNIWVGTLDGLDRFREFAVRSYAVNQGLSSAIVVSVLADKEGSVWLATTGGLDRWNHGQVTTYDKRDGKLNGHYPNSLFQDSHGRIWVSTYDAFGYLQNDRFIPVSAVPGGLVHGIAEDTAGTLWIANQDVGLFHLLPGNVVQQIPWAGLGHKDSAYSLAADPKGGIWIGFYGGGVDYFSDGGVRTSYSTANGLGEGSVSDVRLDADGTLWASTVGGLSRVKNGRVATLSSKTGLPCDAVHWSIEDDDHALWLNMPCGLVRIARSEMDSWAHAVDKVGASEKVTKQTIQVTVFDSSDGVRSLAYAHGYAPHVAKSSDGKLWFGALDGVSVIDPRHLAYNKLPPPVHIEQVTADHKTYEATPDANRRVRLPPRLRDLQIDYTALSLAAPEKVLFRYKLEGWDRDWQEAGTRRQSFYSNLPPRDYRFRVMACNNSGVWNEAGTFLDFSVAPAYYQTWWFRSLCVATSLSLLAAIYQLRLRRVAQQFNMRMEERVRERTRIARDLHDTLLQSFHGVMLKFYAVTYMLPDRPAEARQTLEGLVDQASQAISEGRSAVQGLRSSTVITNDLALALTNLGRALADDQSDGKSPAFHVEVEGEPRDLHPILRDEVYRIASEAVRNAFRHSGAERIEAEIRYDDRQLRLRVRDNGKGIDPQVLNGGGRAGHYGLPGMHERAKSVGAKLAVWSELDSGSEVELTIPAALAYGKSPASHRSVFFRKGA